MNRRAFDRLFIVVFTVFVTCLLAGCTGNKSIKPNDSSTEADYISEVFPLEREGIDLHLECMKQEGMEPDKSILLIHGVTYSSHEFDINYQDYSLVRKLALVSYPIQTMPHRILLPRLISSLQKPGRRKLICWAGAGERSQ